MKIRNRFVIRSLARVISLGCRLLYSTCRRNVLEKAPLVSPFAPTGDERYIYCTWHDGILGSLFSGTPLNCSALTSLHEDGEYVAEVMETINIKPIRGSSSQGGAAAVKQMMEAADRYHVVVTTDGPRGPRRKVKPGIIFLASYTGRRIVPVAISAKRAWKPQGRWTDLLIPKPFTTVYAIGGEPMSIPPDITRQQLRPFCEELQQRIDQLQEEADQLAAGIDPDQIAKKQTSVITEDQSSSRAA